MFANYIKSLVCYLIMVAFFVPTTEARDFVVVIDPGHGGKDYGAIGNNTNEKTITLNVVKLLGEMITKECDDVKVVYTRSSDVFISLQERANIANKANGDLFISIHVNSVDKKSPNRKTVSGTSVYTLGLHRSAENLNVAKRENSVIELEKDYSTTYSGFDPNSTESYIMFEISQNKHMMQSIEFASSAQKELITTAGRNDKGVRQAGFWVLWATSMPAVLIELDFICNPNQEKFLASADGQKKLATSIFNAFVKYKDNYIHQLDAVQAADYSGSDLNNANAEVELVQEDHSVQSGPVNQETKATKEVTNKSTETKENAKEVRYKVQFLTSKTKLEKASPQFKNLYPIDYYYDEGLYKYTYGEETSLKKAKKILDNVKKKFPQAFIITIENGKRIK